MDRKSHLRICHSIPGQTWPVETAWLYDNLKFSKAHVEVGTYCGRSLWASVGQMRDATVYTIDNGAYRDDPMAHPDKHWGQAVYQATLSAIKGLGRGVDVIPIHTGSVPAAIDLAAARLRFDSVFIDGDHSYPNVLADIQCFLPLMNPGGIICGHDYWAGDVGVMDAVNEVFGETFTVPAGRIWCHRVSG